jgi:hypothetical protein
MSAGQIWITKAFKAFLILVKPEETDGQDSILVRTIDDATEDEIDEISNLTPYDPLQKSFREESLEYLNIMLPNISNVDKEEAKSYIYRCVACNRLYPIWWISKLDWQKSPAGFLQKIINMFWQSGDPRHSVIHNIFLCKDCFEEIDTNPPKYFTINQYIEHRLVRAIGVEKEKKPELKRILSLVWDLPAA